MRAFRHGHVIPSTYESRPGKEGKEFGVSIEKVAFVEYIQKALEEVQEGLYADALAFREDNVKDVSSYEELSQAISEGFWARGPWAGMLQNPTLMISAQRSRECGLWI